MKTNLVEGKIDTGKTKGYMFNKVNDIISKEESFLVVDIKSEYYENYYKLLKEKNYNIKVLNLNETNKSNNYNPFSLAYKYKEESEMEKAIKVLKNITDTMFSSTNLDKFWDESASSLVMGICLMLLKETTYSQFNIGTINNTLDLITKGYKDSDLIKMYMEKLDINDPIYINLSSILLAPIETKFSIVSVAKTKIKNFCLSKSMLDLVSSNEIKLDNKTAIFIMDKNRNDLTNILINQIYYEIKNEKFNFILDNIDFVNKIDCLNEMLELPKENIETYVITRNLDKLEKIYGSIFDDVINKVINPNVSVQISKQNKVTYPVTKEDRDYLMVEEHLINLLDK